MKQKFLLIIGILFCYNVIAQKPKIEKPDYKKIKSEVTNKNSKMYYPNLFERYRNFDTTLKKEEFKFLYYGYLFQDSYKPYGNSIYSDSLKKVYRKESLSSDDLDTIIKYEKLVLKDCPFDLRDLNMLAYGYSQKGNKDSVKLIDYELNNLIMTILSTGDGIKEKSAWHVISVGHEYDILNILGYKFGGMQSLTNKGCDYLVVGENRNGIKGFYFDVNMILEAESKLFKK